jgi:hypothetical protein
MTVRVRLGWILCNVVMIGDWAGRVTGLNFVRSMTHLSEQVLAHVNVIDVREDERAVVLTCD